MIQTFSVPTKWNVFKEVALSILLYGAENTWTIKAPDLRQLTNFHNHCVQWREHIATWNLSEAFGRLLTSLWSLLTKSSWLYK